MVLANFRMVILFTSGMVYIAMESIALDNFFVRKGASADMCEGTAVVAPLVHKSTLLVHPAYALFML